MENTFLVLNSFFYLLFAIYVKRRTDAISSYMIPFIWFISSLASIVYFNSPIYYITWYPLTLIPFIFLFICFVFSFKPLMNFNNNSFFIKESDLSLFYVEKIVIFIICITIFSPFIETLFHNLFGGGVGLMSLGSYYESALDGEINDVDYMDVISKKFHTLQYFFQLISPILFFRYIIFSENRNIFIVVGLILSSIYVPFFGLFQGQRYGFVQQMLLIIFIYFLFKKYLSEEVNKNIKKYFLIFFGLLLIVFIIISLTRFQTLMFSKVSPIDFLYRYAGEAFPNFNGDMFHINHFTNGSNSFGRFLDNLGLLNFPFDERHYYLTKITGIRSYVFYTFIGDIFSDFGFWTLLICFLIGNIFSTKKEEQGLAYLICFAVYVNIILSGMFYYVYCVNGIWGLEFAFLFAILIKIEKFLYPRIQLE